MGSAPARYLVFFQYFGTRYSGVMETKSDQALVGVQNYLEKAAEQLKPSAPIKFQISSRTDSGVHALANAAHLDVQRAAGRAPFTGQQLLQGLNRHLRPEPIRILSAQQLPVENLWNFCVSVNVKPLEFVSLLPVPSVPQHPQCPAGAQHLPVANLWNFGVPVNRKSLELVSLSPVPSVPQHPQCPAGSQHLPVEKLWNFGVPVNEKPLEFLCPCQWKTFGIFIPVTCPLCPTASSVPSRFPAPVNGKSLEFWCLCQCKTFGICIPVTCPLCPTAS
ncbi:tRNA pseudouridine synthase-like 1 isoform X4 [Passer domesticus]|uniref:tRNA pseudouridine synthase-like 1 isoform X4 n=1 Tax=Passer domesticus TaxID=48849 RepID=UPI0030FE1C06